MARSLLRTLALLVASGVFLGIAGGADEKPKYTIKQVMVRAHEDGLLAKVLKGMANREEKDELVALYVALTQNKPPKGDVKSWQRKTTALLEAAKAVAKNDKDEKAVAKLDDLTDCTQCHADHRIKKSP